MQGSLFFAVLGCLTFARPSTGNDEGPKQLDLVQKQEKVMLLEAMDAGDKEWDTSKAESERRSGSMYSVSPGTCANCEIEQSVTLSLQCDVDHTKRIMPLLDLWKGPISISVLLRPGELPKLERFTAKMSQYAKDNVAVHVVQADSNWDFYPINFMRNVALENVKSTWVYLLDIDEDVSGDMASHLAVLDAQSQKDDEKTVFVARSFQWKSSDAVSRKTPRSFEELLSAIASGRVIFKHPYFDRAYDIKDQDLSQWASLQKAVPIKPQENFEPYMIARTKELPLFDTRFVGFGGNKSIMMWRLQIEGWNTMVLPNLFTFASEAPDEDKNEDRKKREVQDQKLKDAIISKLAAKVGCTNCGERSSLNSKGEWQPSKWEDCLMSCPKHALRNTKEELHTFELQKANEGIAQGMAAKELDLFQKQNTQSLQPRLVE